MVLSTNPLFQLVRLPFAEDVSAGERFAALARQAAAQASDVTLPVPARLQFFNLADDLETKAAQADAEAILAAHALELA